jgi:hypothetical protein
VNSSLVGKSIAAAPSSERKLPLRSFAVIRAKQAVRPLIRVGGCPSLGFLDGDPITVHMDLTELGARYLVIRLDANHLTQQRKVACDVAVNFRSMRVRDEPIDSRAHSRFDSPCGLPAQCDDHYKDDDGLANPQIGPAAYYSTPHDTAPPQKRTRIASRSFMQT